MFNSNFTCKIIIDLLQKSYRVNFLLLHLIFQRLMDATTIDINLENKGLQQNFVLVKHCQLFNNDGTLVNITVVESSKTEQGEFINVFQFDNCHFSNNRPTGAATYNMFYIMYDLLHLQITNSYFYNNQKQRATRGIPYGNVQITIANTTFVSNTQCERYDLFDLNNVDLHLIGPVLFYNITNVGNVFSIKASNVTCLNYVKFALVEAIYVTGPAKIGHVGT